MIYAYASVIIRQNQTKGDGIINRPFLLAYIKKNQQTIAGFCKSIGMNTATFYRKSTGKSSFTVKEVKTMISVLGIKRNDIIPIFFED